MDLDLTVQEPVTRGGLALFPLVSPSPAAPEYLTGPDAEQRGLLAVGEVGAGEVPSLQVLNTAGVPVLFVEGETLLGARQNRTLNVSVLVPAAARLTIPVACVEAGRWGEARPTGRSGHHVPPDLRALKTDSVVRARAAGLPAYSDQGAVWQRVGEYHTQFRMAAPSAALDDVFEDPAVGGELGAAIEELEPLPDQRGVVVAVGGRVRGIDCFDKPATLAAYWEGLVAGYAVDAVRAPAREASVADAKGFVARVLAAEWVEAPSVGLGVDRTLSVDGLAGQALEWEGAVVHLAAFATDGAPPRAGRISRARWFAPPPGEA